FKETSFIKVYNENEKFINDEKIKYDKILKEENVIDIYNYFMTSIDNYEYYPVEIMNYVFENSFKIANENEKFSLFYMYYKNMENKGAEYYTYLNTSSN